MTNVPHSRSRLLYEFTCRMPYGGFVNVTKKTVFFYSEGSEYLVKNLDSLSKPEGDHFTLYDKIQAHPLKDSNSFVKYCHDLKNVVMKNKIVSSDKTILAGIHDFAWNVQTDENIDIYKNATTFQKKIHNYLHLPADLINNVVCGYCLAPFNFQKMEVHDYWSIVLHDHMKQLLNIQHEIDVCDSMSKSTTRLLRRDVDGIRQNILGLLQFMKELAKSHIVGQGAKKVHVLKLYECKGEYNTKKSRIQDEMQGPKPKKKRKIEKKDQEEEVEDELHTRNGIPDNLSNGLLIMIKEIKLSIRTLQGVIVAYEDEWEVDSNLLTSIETISTRLLKNLYTVWIHFRF